MKRNQARQYAHRRDQTPSVIYLPPPKPPVAAKPASTMAARERPANDARQASARPGAMSRQARRKAMREEAKARWQLRPQANEPSQSAEPVQASEAPQVAEAAMPAPVPPEPSLARTEASPVASADASAPLPRARALVAAQPRGLALFTNRMLVMIGIRRTAIVPAGQGAIGQQLRTLRDELAALQRSLDRMIDGVTG